MRDTGTDDRRVHVRPSGRSRPRTKIRPDWSSSPLGWVTAIDRGRYSVGLFNDGSDTIPPTLTTRVHAVRARELGRGSIVLGDRVRLTGDLSGRRDTLARIVAVEDRDYLLRRSLEDAPDSRGEKAIVANAQLLVIVTALADPAPRVGMIDRCLVAAHAAGMDALICLTKADLADPQELRDAYKEFGVPILSTSLSPDGHINGLDDLRTYLDQTFSVLVGHSGVGKSTLFNALIPDAQRLTGAVNSVTGKGRHTSTSMEAFELPHPSLMLTTAADSRENATHESPGWVADTPGVRSFGLGHVTDRDILDIFPEVLEASTWCMPLCTHLSYETSCALDSWRSGEHPFMSVSSDESRRRSSQVDSVRRLLESTATARRVSREAR